VQRVQGGVCGEYRAGREYIECREYNTDQKALRREFRKESAESRGQRVQARERSAESAESTYRECRTESAEHRHRAESAECIADGTGQMGQRQSRKFKAQRRYHGTEYRAPHRECRADSTAASTQHNAESSG
jgi:hypothetical protein